MVGVGGIFNVIMSVIAGENCMLIAVDYVCVMDVGMFEISLRTTNTTNAVSSNCIVFAM